MRALSLCTCCRHYPGTATGGTASLIRPVISAFPERVIGSACALAFSRLTQRSLALRPAHSRCHQFVARLPEGFRHFVTSMPAPVASGWSGCRVGLAPTGKRRLFTAHTRCRPSLHAVAAVCLCIERASCFYPGMHWLCAFGNDRCQPSSDEVPMSHQRAGAAARGVLNAHRFTRIFMRGSPALMQFLRAAA